MSAPDLQLQLDRPEPLDVRGTLRPLQVWGGDPALRFDGDRDVRWALRSPEGPVSLRILVPRGSLVLHAWGPGSAWAARHLRDLVGLDDGLEAFAPTHPTLRALAERFPGTRLPKTRGVVAMLVPIVLGQLVTTEEAQRAYKGIERALGEAAPGPLGLRLPPPPAVLAGVPVERYVGWGALAGQARTIKRLCAVAGRLEEAAEMGFVAAADRLQALPGLGPWTAGSAMLQGMGFADAVILGDYHLPHMVAWTLAGEARADDARMLELLRPFKGHRGRVLRLLLRGGSHAPRRGPKLPIRTVW